MSIQFWIDEWVIQTAKKNRLRDILKDLEWSQLYTHNVEYIYRGCPICQQHSSDGHKNGCRLDAALKETE